MANRKTMNISLPPQMKAWLDREVDAGQFGSASEYIRHLVRQAQVVSSRESIDEKLREALEGPAPTPMTKADWKRIRRDGDRRVAKILSEQGGAKRPASLGVIPVVVKTPSADRDIEDEYVHIALDSPASAVRFLDRLDATLSMLAASPGVGREWESKVAGSRGVRIWTVTGFRSILVLYRRTGKGIVVLRVLHGARDIERTWESGE